MRFIACLVALAVGTARAVTTSLAPGENIVNDAGNAATSGDVLELADGTYTRSISSGVNQPVLEFPGTALTSAGATAAKELTIRAVNPGKAVLDGRQASQVINADGQGAFFENTNEPLPKLTLSGLKIVNGGHNSVDGGCMSIMYAEVIFQDCTISDCIAPAGGIASDNKAGGGMFMVNAKLTMSDCEMSNNASPYGGAIFFMNSDRGWVEATIENTRFVNNTATTMIERKSKVGQIVDEDHSKGGAIRAEGVDVKLVLRHNTFSGNYASGGGGCDIDTVRLRTIAATTSGGLTIPFVASDSELLNNSFSSNTEQCVSGIMLLIKAPVTQRCTALGEWASPAPMVVPPSTFTGCRSLCNPGTYGESYVLTDGSCTASCTVGNYCPIGSAAPTPCPLNTYMPATGASVCTNCPAFSTTEKVGQASLSACSCAKGRYMVMNTNEAVCTSCPAFSTTTITGSVDISDCICDKGLFMDIDVNGNAFCQQCDQVIPSTTTLKKGATSSAQCVCLPGYYEETNATSGAVRCVKCDPDLMDCTIVGLTLANMPIKPGGWRLSNNSEIVHECFNPLACAGATGPNGTIASPSTRRRRLAAGEISTAGDSLCAEGHRGFLCECASPIEILSTRFTIGLPSFASAPFLCS